MDGSWAAVAFGLLASLCWGAGDFSGSAAAKRMSVMGVVALSHLLGVVILLVLALVSREASPTLSDLAWGAAAGLAGAVGLMALYQALAVGKAGVAAPVTSVIAAVLPVGWSLSFAGVPGASVILGIVLGLFGVVLVSASDFRWGSIVGLRLAVIGGLGFGIFYILIAQFSEGALFYPLAAARAASAMTALVLVLAFRHPLVPPTPGVLGVLALAGGLDIAGNAFYTLATQTGRLDVAALLSSLYPAVTIVLAYVIRRERILPVQGVGIALALLAVGLIGIG